MGRQAWSVRVEDREHRVEVEHGHWGGGVTIRLDDSIVLRGRPLLAMSFDRGLDLPIFVAGHSLVVAIRPVFWARTLLVSGYRYALSVDGQPAAGTVAVPPVVRGKRPGLPSLNDVIEAGAWGAGGTAAAQLLLQGPAVMAPVILGASALCSLVVRQCRELPGWLRLALAVGAAVAWVAGSVVVARALGVIGG